MALKEVRLLEISTKNQPRGDLYEHPEGRGARHQSRLPLPANDAARCGDV
jgi:hypothetical protein